MGPQQAAGKQQSLEKKWVDMNWGPEDHRSGLGSRQGLRTPRQLYQKETATIESYAGCPAIEVTIQFTTCTTLHGDPDEATQQ